MTAVNGFVAEYDKSLLQVWVDENGLVHFKASSANFIVELLLDNKAASQLKRKVSEVIATEEICQRSVIVVPSEGAVIIGNYTYNHNVRRTRMVDGFYLGIRSFNSCPFPVHSEVWNKFIADVEAITGPL